MYKYNKNKPEKKQQNTENWRPVLYQQQQVPIDSTKESI